MKDVNMDATWRTVQLFLDDDGIAEVEVDHTSPRKIRCNCAQFGPRLKCKHTAFVKQSMENNDGHYSIKVSADVDEEAAFDAIQNPTSFRDFVISYGKVEVI